MNNRVSKHISNSLNVDHDHVASGILPREMAQSLSYKGLITVRLVHPTSIVVLLDVVTLNIVLSVPVLDLLIVERI